MIDINAVDILQPERIHEIWQRNEQYKENHGYRAITTPPRDLDLLSSPN